MISVTDLIARLPSYLAAQRWFGSGHESLPEVRIESQVVIRQPWPGLVRVVAAIGGARIQLVLGLRPAGEWGIGQVGETAAVGDVAVRQGRAFCFDVVADPELCLVLLTHIAPEITAGVARRITAEQSNTSLVYDERVILKVFRRLAGSNPDVEVTTALTDRGFRHVAAPLAVWRVGGDDCGLVQRFLTGGVEGWALALTSLRDLLASGGLPEEAGGDFGPEAARLGTLTADLHAALAEAFGTAPADPALWAATMEERLAGVSHPDLDHVGIETAMERMVKVADPGRAIRAHGDYHLGQVLRTDEGWFVVDFEGEPMRLGGDGTARTSPLRDVAGMLRSLQYASLVGASEHRGDVTLAQAWEQRNRMAFLGSYLKGMRRQSVLPADPISLTAMLSAFEVDKAVYEVAYELAHRPDWVGIPLAGLRKLVGNPA